MRKTPKPEKFKKKIIRMTPTQSLLEIDVRRGDKVALEDWVALSIKEMEYRIRYSKAEETISIQGALRVLDDIKEILDES